MGGIYIHIPFCRSKCFYCGFYSIASLRLEQEYVRALCREIQLRKDYLPERVVQSLYFGGGTPSYPDVAGLEKVMRALEETWSVAPQAERTLEMNPEDADEGKLLAYRQLGFNRLSIGVQSFQDDVLKRIHRTHSAGDARQALERAAKAGFENISLDLIIGLPGSDRQDVEHSLKIVKELPVNHISVYMLSIDSNTVLEHLCRQGKYTPCDDDELAIQYVWTADRLKDMGFEHYEISNFAKGGKYSVHNTSYWEQKPYLGLGAAAHSYDLKSRQWNVDHVKKYIEALEKGTLCFEKEDLSFKDKYNERIMTRLRTMWGLDEREMEKEFPEYWRDALPEIEVCLKNGFLVRRGNAVAMTEHGWLLSDYIFGKLFA